MLPVSQKDVNNDDISFFSKGKIIFSFSEKVVFPFSQKECE